MPRLDLECWRPGNSGIPYLWSFVGPAQGPHVMVTALVHGNEVCGAIALARLLSAEVRPRRGRLTLAFANFAAYAKYDPGFPFAARSIDRDMNRIWSREALAGSETASEIARARELLPFVDSCDLLLDLHSMSTLGQPVILSGALDKGLRLARGVGFPGNVVRDPGHDAGPRLRDYRDFADPTSQRNALLVECGAHWDSSSVTVAQQTCWRFLLAAGSLDHEDIPIEAAKSMPAQRVIDVTARVTVTSNRFRFLHACRGLEVIAEAGTPIARDGERTIVTPFDDCVLVMPSVRPAPGDTAVRFGRVADEA